MIQIKEGVSILGLDPKLVLALIICDQVYHDNGIEDCVLTSGTDSKHGDHSHHYKGYAIDLRTSNVEINKRAPIASVIQKQLGNEYQVILENDHIHVEFDPK